GGGVWGGPRSWGARVPAAGRPLDWKPNRPQNAAGRMTEPPVCVPSAAGTMKSATAAAEPLDEPPGVRLGSSGFAVAAGVTCANSVVAVLPMTMAPAARSRATQFASRIGRKPWRIAQPYSVCMAAGALPSLAPLGPPREG